MEVEAARDTPARRSREPRWRRCSSPFFALIAALLLQGGQPDPRNKAQLRSWAWIAGGLLAFEFVSAVVLALVTV